MYYDSSDEFENINGSENNLGRAQWRSSANHISANLGITNHFERGSSRYIVS